MKPYVVDIIREDENEMSCIIEMPIEFNPSAHVFGHNDKFDELIDLKIMDKIFFKGLGYSIKKIKELK